MTEPSRTEPAAGTDDQDPLASAAVAMLAAIRATAAERMTGWTDLAFNRHALELFRAQYECVPAYRAWCDHELSDRGSVSVTDVSRWQDVPALPIEAFKRLRVAPEAGAGDEPEAAVWHSSGTTGANVSRHHLRSTELYEASLAASAFAALVPGPDDDRLVAVQLAASGADAPASSLSHMLDTIRLRICHDGGAWVSGDGVVDSDGAWARLARAAGAGEPVLLLATSIALALLFDATADGDAIALPAGSRVMDTGGAKGTSRTVNRAELVTLVGERLGVAAGMCENEYGMSELSSQAYLGTIARQLRRPLPGHQPGVSDGDGELRWQPPWFRTRVVDPATLREIADGETGLLVHHDLANAWSCAVVRSEDIGVRRGRSYELVGRAAGAALRGCSLQLQDVLE